jgi:ArsR family metal-binding transcriptional regulator
MAVRFPADIVNGILVGSIVYRNIEFVTNGSVAAKEGDLLLRGYTLEIFRSKCNAGAQTLHCFAHLDDDVGKALPYLNTVLGGFSYILEPPSLTLKSSGKLITIHSRKIAVNALQDEDQAEKIVAWLQREINSAWENRETIQPSLQGVKPPILMDVLKLLPKTNCKECGEPTCMVFAVRVVEGAKDHTNCPPLQGEKKEALAHYLSGFHFD